uniref:Protein Wnt n=1 Tax=Sycon ciliatum TaxID=27933 RepID=A0A077SN19_9METZ|nr:Wnt H SciWntH [Sycon ciliatum]
MGPSMISLLAPLLLLLTLSACNTANGIWWDTAASDSLHKQHAKHCPESAKLNSSLQLCRLSGEEITSLMKGAAGGIFDCQMLMASQRWNCSSSDWKVFLGKTHKEAAFVHAVISIAVSAQLVHDCNNGRLPSTTICGTNPSCQGSSCTKEIITYGYSTAKILDWLNSPDQLQSMKWRQALLHNHNRDVGRVVVKKQMKKTCDCNGISASCLEMRCYHRLPSTREMVSGLMNNAVFLPWKEHRNQVHHSLKTVRRRRSGKTTLVFMKRSPSYCCTDRSQGILGTEGRSCNSHDSCRKICCSEEKEEIGLDKCNCKFIFCCELKCEKCLRRQYRCKKSTCSSSTSSRSRDEL